MTNRMGYDLRPGGIAVRLGLISKLHGLGKAEEYFNSLPSSLRVDKVHRAMLNCYAEKRSLTKADDLFEKMKELGFVKSALNYNVMLSLYSHIGDYDKLDILVQEMKENGVAGDSCTFNIRLNVYADTDVERMEKLFTEMEADSQVKVDLYGYFTAIKGYLKAGLFEKALPMIRKAEELTKSKGNRIDYEHLMTLYASAGRKDDVYRIWNLYKIVGRVFNTGYLSVLSSLVKLEDLDGVDKIFEEWESWATDFDRRIANLLINAYCKKGLLEKALACAERLTSRGNILDPMVWHCLAMHCCADGQMAKAVEMMRKAILASRPKLRLDHSTLAACLEYLKREGDKEAVHEILGFLKESTTFSGDVCNRLLDFVNSDKDSGALAAMIEEKKKKEIMLLNGKANEKAWINKEANSVIRFSKTLRRYFIQFLNKFPLS